MLEGLEISEVMSSQISNVPTDRIDAEYYRKEFVHDEVLIQESPENFQKFIELGLEINASAFYPSIEPYYNQGELPFLRVADVDGMIDYKGCTTIPVDLTVKHPTLRLVCEGDLVLTKGGSIARIGYVEQTSAVSRDLIFVNTSILSKEDSNFIYLYLQTPFANRLLLRSGSQSVQAHLTITLVRDVPIFSATTILKKKLLFLIEESRRANDESKRLSEQAETLLLEAIGLQNFTPSEENTNIKSFQDSFLSSGRLDAEYYQPKYEEVQEQIIQTGQCKTIGSLTEFVQRGKQPIYTDNREGNVLPVVNSKHVRTGKVILDDNRFATKVEGAVTISKNDVLINGTGVGTIGRSAAYLHDADALPDNHVTVLRNSQVEPIYLATFLNSPLGQLQVEQNYKGSSGQIELYPSDIESFYVWVAPDDVQESIRKNVQASYELENESAHLLEVAKRAVEMAIEEDEAAAMRYIEGNSAVDE